MSALLPELFAGAVGEEGLHGDVLLEEAAPGSLHVSHFAEWDAAKHPRGHAGNAGQFAAGAGGTAQSPAPKKLRDPFAARLPKALRAAGRYRSVARRRRAIAAVKREAEVATAIGGINLPDSEPADVVYAEDAAGKPITDPLTLRHVLAQREEAMRILRGKRQVSAATKEAAARVLAAPCHFLEVKTLLTAQKGLVRIGKRALRRKERWSDRYGVSFSVVAIDDRRGHKHSGHRVHLSAGELAGTFHLRHMERVADLAAIKERLEGIR